MTKKREIDLVSIIAVAVSALTLTFFASWLHYSNKVDKIMSSYEMRSEMMKSSMENLKEKNKELETELQQLKSFVKTNQDSSNAQVKQK